MSEEKQEKKRSKLTSVKLWVTIWAIVMVSFIVVANRTEFLNIAQPLCFVPLGYLGVNVWQKKIYEDGAK
jgi:hypothetical protein|nr:MAG TPA: hypothetical protein [Caudoviricetes sp.]DAU05658.1 MAG TPA: hypothetical protein [Caudoviricetes sp.]